MSEENNMFEGGGQQSDYSAQPDGSQQPGYNEQPYNSQQPEYSTQSDNSQQSGYSEQPYNNQQSEYNQQSYSNQQPDYNGQPGYSNQPYNNYTQPSSGFGIASMVCGIIALITCCLWCTCIPLAVVSIVLGILQIQKGTAKGMAIAGIVCSAIALILFVVLTVWGNYLQSSGAYNEILRELERMQYQ